MLHLIKIQDNIVLTTNTASGNKSVEINLKEIIPIKNEK